MAAPSDTANDGGTAGVLLVDPDGLIRTANARAAELFGTAASVGQSLREANIHDLVCEPSEMELAEHLACACGMGPANPSDMLLQRTDGNTFWARVQSEVATEEEGGDPAGVVLVRLTLEEIEDPMSDMERLFASDLSLVFETPKERRPRVMLVDDEVAALAETTFMLEGLEHEVMGYSDAKLALEEFTSRPDNYDAVIVDAALPPLDGLALCRAFFEVRAEVPILLATRVDQSIDVASAIELGVDEVLAKPLEAEEVAQWLRGVTPVLV